MWMSLFAQTPTPTDWWEKLLTFIIGAVGGWVSGTLAVRGQQRVAVDGLVQKIIELSMAHPYLERDSYCKAWVPTDPAAPLPNPPTAADDDKTRYENYCCLVFNTIEKAWELCWPWWFSASWRHGAVKKILQVEELICRHHSWWSKDPDNLEGYSAGFRSYMSHVIDECKKRGVKL